MHPSRGVRIMTPLRRDTARGRGGPEAILRQDTTAQREHITASVRRLRLAARGFGLHAIFVADWPQLIAELFDAWGGHIETWSWPC